MSKKPTLAELTSRVELLELEVAKLKRYVTNRADPTLVEDAGREVRERSGF